MSLAATLTNALAGLNVAQRALAVTANNVANANTEGYSRKVVGQEAVILGGRGAGVETAEITRVTDRFLAQEVRRQSSTLGRSGTLQRYQDLLQDAFGAPGDNRDIGAQISRLAAALEGLANNPETSALALDVLRSTEDMSGAIGGLADQVQRLRGAADGEIGQLVGEISGELQAIHDLNDEIQRLAHLGEVSPELFDRRDALVNSLAEKIDISTFRQDDDTLAIYTAGGEILLDDLPRVVHYDPASTVRHDTTFGAIKIFREDQIDPATGQPIDPTAGIELVTGGIRATLTPELQNDAVPDVDQRIVSRLRAGKLQGLLETRDQVLPNVNDQIQELAEGLRFALNAAHNDGSPWPPPAQLSGTRSDLSDFAGATRSGLATIAVVDTSDGSTLLAFQLDLGAVADESALAAQIDTSLGALGSAQIGAGGNLEITLAGADQGLAIAEGDSSITVTDAAGRDRDYGLAHYFGLNDLLVQESDQPSDFGLRADIVADPSLLSTARLDVAGPPLVATLGGRGDNRAVQDLAESLRAEHDVIARGGLPAKATPLTEYAGDIIAHSATLAQQAKDGAARDRSLAEALDYRAAAVSGVNLDEEMARMVQLQQAYSVAARIVSITDQLFDELLGTVR